MLKTKGIYASGMVLQQNTTNCIFGIADANKEIIIDFKNQKFFGKVQKNGEWKVEFEVGDAGGPFELKIFCENEKIIFSDVYVGEVWLSSGQSNAQLPMERMKYSYPNEFTLPQNDKIRMITIPIAWNFDGEQDSVENPTWKVANSQNIGEMSGTGYFFAKYLSAKLNVPVGIINASQGGSPISSWIDKKTLQKLEKKENLNELSKWENPKNIEEKQKSLAENQKKWDSTIWNADKGIKENWAKLTFGDIQNIWSDINLPNDIEDFETAGIIWFKKEIILSKEQAERFNSTKTNLWLGTIVDADRTYVNGVEVGVTYYTYPPRRYIVPSGVFVEGKNTITIRVQKNSKFGKIRFYKEKPYCLFTDDEKVPPVAFRNIEIQKKVSESPLSKNSEIIYLDGKWKMCISAIVEDAPQGMFFEWVPTALYNAMLSPCFNYAIKGSLWYQGESDAGCYSEYKDLLKNLIDLWREKFVYANKNMPFIVVQLPNWSDGFNENNSVLQSEWACMRQVQSQVCDEKENVGLAVTIDAGEWNDLHPEKKLTVGKRSAFEALRIAYKNHNSFSPKVKSVQVLEDKAKVKFDCGESSLVAKFLENKDEIPGFSLIFENKNKKEVVETFGKLISDAEVEVFIPKKEGNLTKIRYLWADSPNPVCIYSKTELPVRPFEIEI